MSNEKNLIRRKETTPTTPEYVKDTQTVAPRVDIYENKDEILMIADIPGVGQDQVSIHLEKNELTLEAHHSNVIEGTILAAEYRPFDYRRVFVVPQGINAEKITAELKNGVLQVHLPKSEALKPRQIRIQAG